MAQKEEKETNVAWWLKLLTQFGLPTFLLLWLFGAMPWLPSPLTTRLEAHDRMSKSVLTLICKGLWKESTYMQTECERAGQ